MAGFHTRSTYYTESMEDSWVCTPLGGLLACKLYILFKRKYYNIVVLTTCVRKEQWKSIEQNGSNDHTNAVEVTLEPVDVPLYKWWEVKLNTNVMSFSVVGLSWSVVRKPDCRGSLISGIEPTNTGEMKEIVPFGVHATRNLAVLWCLYWLHVKDCMHRSEGASKKKRFHFYRWWQKYSGTIL